NNRDAFRDDTSRRVEQKFVAFMGVTMLARQLPSSRGNSFQGGERMQKTGVALASGVVVVVLWGAIQTVPAHAQNSPKKGEQELLQIEKDWCQASLKTDAVALARILADDYTYVGSRGGQTNKTQELSDLKSTESTTTDCTDENVKVRVY